MRRPLLIAAVSLLIAACSASSSNPTSPSAPPTGTTLEGPTWVLTAGIPGAPRSGRGVIDITFENGHASGSSGCNSYGGSYTVAGSSLKFGPLTSTMMACADSSIMSREAAYVAALDKVDAYAISGTTLTLSGPSVNLVYSHQAAPASLPLVGSHWMLNTLFSGTTASTVIGTPPDATFATDGSVSGSDGCNRYHATYVAGADRALKVGPLAGTKMACEQAVVDQANAFAQAMVSVAPYAIEGSVLTLRDAAGNPLLGFQGAVGPS